MTVLSKFETCLDFHNVLCPFTDIFARALPSKYLLAFKTSWRRLKDKSWRCLHHVFSVTIFCLSRYLEDVFWRGVTKANIFVLIKPSWNFFWRQRRKTSLRCLQDVFIRTNICWVYSFFKDLTRISNLYDRRSYDFRRSWE